jgi:hypothetical protein
MVRAGSPRTRYGATLLAAALSPFLSTCGTSGVSSLLVTPGKYDTYTCPQIADVMGATEGAGRQLEALMAQANKGDGGPFVSKIAYESDYLANRGELHELQKSAAAKNCNNQPNTSPAPSSGALGAK